MSRCVTHHYACDCREAKFAEIEAERDRLRAACEAMAGEIARLRGVSVTAFTHKRILAEYGIEEG